jgi:hypothetical protein
LAELSPAVGDVTYDAAGNLYIADNFNNVVRRVDVQGIIQTVAGTGVAGDGADGVQAQNVALNDPRGVAMDSSGNLYIADRNNSKVRKVSPNGVISTFYSILGPDTVVVDGNDNVFVLSGYSHVIRELNPAGLVLRTVPGNFGDIAVEADGTIVQADLDNLQVVRIDTAGLVTRIAGQGDGVPGFGGDGGPAVSARFAGPIGVVIDKSGTIDLPGAILVSDRENHRIRSIRPDGTIDTIAGDGTSGYCGEWIPAASSWLGDPSALAFDPTGSLAFIDDARVRQLSIPDAPVPTATSTPCGPSATPYQGPASPTPPPTNTPTPTWTPPVPTATASPTPDCTQPFSPPVAGCATDTPTPSFATVTPMPTDTPCAGACPTPPATSTPNCAQQTSPPIAGCPTGTPFPTATVTPTPDCTHPTSPPNAACIDSDGDGVPDSLDNCPGIANADQLNTDAANTALNRPGADPFGDPCDGDIDGDGYTNVQEIALGKDPAAYCPIMRADVDGDGVISILDLAKVAQYFAQSVPPAPDRYRQDADFVISILDLTRMSQVFTKHVTACP